MPSAIRRELLNDQGKLRGEGILALNFDYGNGLSTFVQGDVRGGEGLFGAGGKGGFQSVVMAFD